MHVSNTQKPERESKKDIQSDKCGGVKVFRRDYNHMWQVQIQTKPKFRYQMKLMRQL